MWSVCGVVVLGLLAGCSDGIEVSVFPSGGSDDTIIIVQPPTETPDCPPFGQGHGKGPCG